MGTGQRPELGYVRSPTFTNIKEHEDLICDHLGEDWRTKRDMCEDIKAWRKATKHIPSETLLRCKLNLDKGADTQGRDGGNAGGILRAGKGRSKGKSQCNGEEEEEVEWDISRPEPMHQGDGQWQHTTYGIRFVTDSFNVQQVLCGHMVCSNKDIDPILNRITETMQKIRQQVYSWPHRRSDPVEWRPREFNKTADALCNRILVHGEESITFTSDEARTFIRGGALLTVHTDGGCRGHGISAVGWMVRATVCVNENQLPPDSEQRQALFPYRHEGHGTIKYISRPALVLMYGNARIIGNHSSFVLEAIAIDKATTAIAEAIREYGSPDRG